MRHCAAIPAAHHTLTLENNLRSPHTFVAQLGDNTRSCNGTANSGQLPHATCSWVLDGCPVPSFKGSSGNVLWWMIPELLPPVDAAAGLLPLPAPAPAPAPADMAACVCLCRRPIPRPTPGPAASPWVPRERGRVNSARAALPNTQVRKRSRHEPENSALAAGPALGANASLCSIDIIASLVWAGGHRSEGRRSRRLAADGI